MCRISCFLLSFVIGCAFTLVQAQHLEPLLPTGSASGRADQLMPGASVVALNGPWEFRVGDSPIDPATHEPAWAQQDYDDSAWETLNLAPRPGSIDPFDADPRYVPGWTATGHPGYVGWAWYRLHVIVWLAPGERLALAGPAQVDDSYQVFADGKLLGSYDDFRTPGKPPTVHWTQPAMFSLPAANNTARTIPIELLLSFRVWMGTMGLLHSPDAGGLRYAPLLGEANAISAQIQLEWLELLCQSAYHPLEAGLFLLLGIVAASLLLFDRSDPVYPWLAGVLVLTTLQDILLTVTNLTKLVSSDAYFLLDMALLGPLLLGGWGIVWWIWFQLRRPSWMPKAIVVLTCVYMLSEVLGGEYFTRAIPHSLAVVCHAASIVIRLLFLAVLVLIAVRGIREHRREGWFVLPAVTLVALAQFSSELLVLHMPVLWAPFGISVFIGEVAHILLAGAIALLLLRRLLHSVRRQRIMALDLKQAQELQQVMLPEARTTLPGLVIESEYRPALEVGGDFFQIIPRTADGSLLIVAGDVTGKGLKAGMLVAMLVGAIRTAADFNLGPEALLRALNKRLRGRNEAYATCMALNIASDGEVTLANAGHMAPYLNGELVTMEGALPLGLVEGMQFPISRFRITEGDRLILISDGVVEATNAEGHLFGFDRVHELLREEVSAADIVRVAEAFGQQDDISVILVTRTAVLAPVLERTATLVRDPIAPA